MAGVTKLKIQESIEDLGQRLQAETNPYLKERLQVLYFLKLSDAMSISAIAKVMGKHRGTLQRLLCRYEITGLSGLLAVKRSPGRPRAIPAWAVRPLQQRLKESGGFKSYGEIQ